MGKKTNPSKIQTDGLNQPPFPKASWAAAAFFGLLFAYLGLLLTNQELGPFDQEITKIILAYRSPVITRWMKIITDMGSFHILAGITIPLVFWLVVFKKRYLDGIMMSLALPSSHGLTLLLKSTFFRARPDFSNLVSAPGYSFPSGHAMVSLVFYGMLAYLLTVNGLRYRNAAFAYFCLAALVMLIGISRIYLGVHYPSDVAAGFAAGAAWMIFCVSAWRVLRRR